MVFEKDAPAPHYDKEAPKETRYTDRAIPAKKSMKRKTMEKFMQLPVGHETQPAEEELVPEVIKGFVGANKGLKDILYERGLLDPAVKYTMEGVKVNGEVE